MRKLRQFIWKTSSIWLLSNKVKNGLSPEIMTEIFVFQENETYNLRSGNHLARKNVWTTQYEIENISSLGATLWNLYTRRNKNSSSLPFSRTKLDGFNGWIRWIKRIPEKCLCKLCQTYKKCWLYLTSLRHLLELALYFDLKSKSL